MKVLSIGNSFSEDAHRWLHSISEVGKTKIDAVNLMIGGCTLERHYNNIKENKPDYDVFCNGLEFIKKSSANEVLAEDKYDVVTIQQSSGLSGVPASYIPYLTEIVNYVKEKQPDAKIFFYKTWCYEYDFTSKRFEVYARSQEEMFRRISDCADMVKKLAEIDILPVGDFIRYLRVNTKEFDYRNGGASLCRDGYHLSLNYGRFAAAAVWYKEFTGEKIDGDAFVRNKPDFDVKTVKLIIEDLEKFYSGR